MRATVTFVVCLAACLSGCELSEPGAVETRAFELRSVNADGSLDGCKLATPINIGSNDVAGIIQDDWWEQYLQNGQRVDYYKRDRAGRYPWLMLTDVAIGGEPRNKTLRKRAKPVRFSIDKFYLNTKPTRKLAGGFVFDTVDAEAHMHGMSDLYGSEWAVEGEDTAQKNGYLHYTRVTRDGKTHSEFEVATRNKAITAIRVTLPVDWQNDGAGTETLCLTAARQELKAP